MKDSLLQTGKAFWETFKIRNDGTLVPVEVSSQYGGTAGRTEDFEYSP
jgi:hypothetical protein